MTRRLATLMAVVLLWATVAPVGAGVAPGVAKPGPRDRCPVCGMFVAPYPTWTAAVQFADGTLAYFDGPKDLFRFVFTPERYDAKRSREAIGDLWVTEYYTTELMPAAGLYFVVGSDVLGPMGLELVPVAGAAQAQGFLKDHQGTRSVPFAEVTPAVLEDLQ